MPVTSKLGAALHAAFTGDDLLTFADHHEARQLNQSVRLLSGDHVDAAYHAAGSAKAAASIAWRLGHEARWPEGQEARWNALQAEHDRACRALIVAIERHVAVPCANKASAEYARRQVRTWASVVGGSPVLKVWRAAEERWNAHLAAEAVRLTKKRRA